MDNTFRQELEKFQSYTAELQGMLSGLQGSRPERAEASDAQGAVRVRVDGGGIPQEITAAADWGKRCKSGGLGMAVVEAARSAHSALMDTWSQNLPHGPWSTSPGRGNVGGDPASRTETPGTSAPEERDTRYVISRPLDQLVEDAISSLSAAGNFDTALGQEAPASGSDPAGRVTITLTPASLTSCDVEPSWAANASVIQINRALGEALADARSALALSSVSEQAEGEGRKLDGLIDEAMAALRDPRRLNNL
ncbi:MULTISPECIES: ATP-binding protein [unclassified Streptomyces]|uniref:ATP-binding protein n=1 Tax=unclassified Streptomyces TaxID=2593676 RepID=UPI00087ED0EA|nr:MULTISPECIES: ATP-binding protein [unclassified Streptomyces]PBC83040.1 hypothetical protein BX261_2965 [Streptomyces sp. 2321.6]SDR45441.1 hypothetical protein SAMN05216511_4236 [Streptomyces sp. KS_16]SEC81687.1 hypothetical protein SAMN05428940_2969 [Streptomyces sp. 2133.1]SNC69118.1 hypothetical protein SAMN06272741_2962 [Streptomyces sp. 2114.4]